MSLWEGSGSVVECLTRDRGAAVCDLSGYICVSNCRSMGHKFNPGPVPYFHVD